MALEAAKVSVELMDSIDDYKTWVADRNVMLAALQRRRKGVQPFLRGEDQPDMIDPFLSASRILGVGTYRAPIPDEEMEPRYSIRGGEPLGFVFPGSVEVHARLDILLRMLREELLAPKSLARLDLAQVWAIITTYVTRAKRPGDATIAAPQWVVVAIAARIGGLDREIAETAVRASAREAGVPPPQINSDVLDEHLTKLFDAATERWKKRLQTARRSVTKLCSVPLDDLVWDR